MSEPAEQTSDDAKKWDGIDRRDYLKSTTVASTMMLLAGCSGSSDNNSGGNGSGGNGSGGNGSGGNGSGGNGSGGTPTGSGSGKTDQTYTTIASVGEIPPPNAQFNPYNPARYPLYVGNVSIIYDWIVQNNYTSSEAKSWAVQDWSFKDQRLRLNLRDNHTWHNGDEVTSEDLRVKLLLEKYIGSTLWDYTENLNIVDDKTIDLNFSQDVRESIVISELGKYNIQLNTPRSVFGKYVERLEKSSSQKEEDKVLSDLTGFSWEDPIGCGPFKLVDRDGSGYYYELHSGYWNSDEIAYTSAETPFANQQQIVNQRVIEGDSTITLVQNPQTISRAKNAENVNLNTNFSPSGFGVSFNYNDDLYSTVEFRQAMMYAINRQQVKQNMGPDIMKAINVPTGYVKDLFDTPISEYLPNIHNELTSYQQDVDKAGKLLKEVGCTQEGSTWHRPNGDELKIVFKAPSNAAWPAMIKGVASSLQNAGFNAEARTIQRSEWGTALSNENYNAIATTWYGPGAIPYYTWKAMYASGSVGNTPSEYQVPEVGNPNGSMITVNVEDELEKLTKPLSAEELTTVRERLAWVGNQAVPNMPNVMSGGAYIYRTDQWSWPNADSSKWSHLEPANSLPRYGDPDVK